MNERVVWTVLTGPMVSYVGTPAWTSTIRGEELRYEQQKEVSDRQRIPLDRTNGSYYMDMEEYLSGVIARQVSVEYRPEALKTQATIARTCIYRQMKSAGGKGGIAESALDMDYLETGQLKKLWSSSRFPEYYKKLKDVVKVASGIVIAYEGKCIDPMYCRATANMTGQGDFNHPYLQTVDCPEDVETEGCMQIFSFSRKSFVSDVNSIPAGGSGPRTVKASQVPDTIQIMSRDDAGYVDAVQIGSTGYTGEEVQYTLGLTSSCFVLEPYEDGIRAVVRGIGHDYGLDQATANGKTKEGWKAEDIFGYFYKDIAFISE